MIETAVFVGGPLGGEVQWIGKPRPVIKDPSHGTYTHHDARSGTVDFDSWKGAAVYRRVDDGTGQPVYEYCGQDPVVVRYTKSQLKKYGLREGNTS